jgi:SAM-dependent methyltransferase
VAARKQKGAGILRILQSEQENVQARAELERRGLSFVRTDLLGRLGRQLRLESCSVGDARKSWDVLRTAEFVEANLPRDAAIVDFGAYHSEITGILSRIGYTNLSALDLNPRLTRGPVPDRIRYVVADFLHSSLPAGTFDAITSISAIEHGHATDQLLDEVSRLLKPGAYFLGSTDYWPAKIDTSGIMIFGMDWRIFSAPEMQAFFDAARLRGLEPAGALEFDAKTPAIHFGGHDYTFAWFALRKSAAR